MLCNNDTNDEEAQAKAEEKEKEKDNNDAKIDRIIGYIS